MLNPKNGSWIEVFRKYIHLFAVSEISNVKRRSSVVGNCAVAIGFKGITTVAGSVIKNVVKSLLEKCTCFTSLGPRAPLNWEYEHQHCPPRKENEKWLDRVGSLLFLFLICSLSPSFFKLSNGITLFFP